LDHGAVGEAGPWEEETRERSRREAGLSAKRTRREAGEKRSRAEEVQACSRISGGGGPAATASPAGGAAATCKP
jgi:hypothetical protein